MELLASTITLRVNTFALGLTRIDAWSGCRNERSWKACFGGGEISSSSCWELRNFLESAAPLFMAWDGVVLR